MLQKIIDFFENKNIAILGFGLEGQSTYNFIINNVKNYNITIIDKSDVSDKLTIKDTHTKIIYGENYLNNLEEYDIIMKTPGINLKTINTTHIKNKISSQLELILQYNSNNIIGITGTKGKSTTTSLIYKTLKDQLKNVYLAGNIGIPIFDELTNYNNDTILVIEMSSHQLEYISKSPHIGIILNLYEDHLDHAGTVDYYHNSKLNMFKFQNKDDIAIYCNDNDTLRRKIEENNFLGKKYKVQLKFNDQCISNKDNKTYYNKECIYIDDEKRHLPGDHNLENIMIASLVAKLFNLNLNKAKESIDSFKGLEHRLEYSGTYNDIIYYCDTIATIPEATISGIQALKKINTLIIGGMDRGINYQPLIDFLNQSTIKNLICMPTTGHKIAKQINNKNINIVNVETLEEAVHEAKIITEKNTICLLSPAASSYEYFKNYIEKGNRFKELIKE